ncbi:MAG: hypothetical protein KF746_24730 [Chitinophagaceae bacterium]|nr:hypothetical protein [Chitinophagaceae bacterium]
MFELTEKIAKDLNEIVAKSLEKNQNHSAGFDIIWYRKVRPDFSEAYCYHLATLLIYYNEKYKREWITVQRDNLTISSNFSTQYFYDQGGYLKIYESETREQNIKKLTEQQLQKSIWQIKGWWIFVLINAAISFLIAWLTR